MLEWQGILRTWDLRELPSPWSSALGEYSGATEVIALPLRDHRMAYLDFEGPLSGDRGTVRCCDRGSYELLSTTDDALQFRLRGALLEGAFQFVRRQEQWVLHHIEE